MHGKGGHVWWRGHDKGGACMVKGACVARGAYTVGGVHGGGMHGVGHAWQERRPLQWTVRILSECILVLSIIINLRGTFLINRATTSKKVFLSFSDTKATDLESCILSCCDSTACNVAFLHDDNCYLITCNSSYLEGCRPKERRGQKFENTYMVNARSIGKGLHVLGGRFQKLLFNDINPIHMFHAKVSGTSIGPAIFMYSGTSTFWSFYWTVTFILMPQFVICFISAHSIYYTIERSRPFQTSPLFEDKGNICCSVVNKELLTMDLCFWQSREQEKCSYFGTKFTFPILYKFFSKNWIERNMK